MNSRWNVVVATVVALGLLAPLLILGPIGVRPADAQTSNGFVPVAPCAVFDTRFGSAFGSLVEGQVSLTAQVSGSVSTDQITAGCAQGGVVPVGAAAVMVNVVAVGPVVSGNLRISAAGESANGGIVNFGPGNAGAGTNSNAVPVGLSASGAVDVFVNAAAGAAATHVRLVVLGYYAAEGAGFVPVAPCAVFDTRFGSAFGSLVEGQVSLTAQVSGSVSTDQITAGCAQGGVVPVGAAAVMVNVVAVGPVVSGNLRISAAGESANGGIVNFGPGNAGAGTNSNAVPVGLSASGAVDVFVNAAAGAAATHVRLVVLGYYAAEGAGFVPVAPCAVFDTRFGSAFGSLVEGQVSLTAQVSGSVSTDQITAGCAQGGVVPVGAAAVMVNVVAVGPVVSGNLRISAAGESANGGIVNFGPGNAGAGTNSNAVPVGLSAAGAVDVFVNAAAGSAATHVRLVVLGYYAAVPTAEITGIITTDGTTPSGTVRACAQNTTTFAFVCEDADAGGEYTLAVTAGTYRAWAFDEAGDYALRIYDQHDEFVDADEFVVGDMDIVGGIDFDLEPGGKISGTVTDEALLPLEGIRACLEIKATGAGRGCFTTEVDGTYEMSNLPAGEYHVRFFPPADSGYVVESYDDTTDYNQRDTVVVVAGSTTANIDALLALGGTVSGTVTSSAGQPLADIDVCANADDFSFRWCVRTDASGNYVIGGLPARNYSIGFTDPAGSYASEYWDNQIRFDFRTFVPVAVGGAVTGLDAALNSGAQTIEGVVTAGGVPVEGIDVCPFVTYDGVGLYLTHGCERTLADGSYSLRGLPATGSFKLRFFDPSGTYVTEYYDDALNFNEAIWLTPGTAATLTGINADLAVGASISGVVTEDPGGPLPFIQVCTWSSDGTVNWCQGTAADGSYTLAGLIPGLDYTVEFIDWSGTYARELYDDTIEWFARTLLTPGVGEAITGIDAALEFGGVSFSGQVVDADTNAPLAGISVCPQIEGLSISGCTRTAGDGMYRITGMPPDTYLIQFSGWNGIDFGDYSPLYYNQALRGDAQMLTPAPGTTMTGIDAALNIGGAIAGHVTGDFEGEPVPGIRVCAVPALAFHDGLCTSTAADGTYRLYPLAETGYYIDFIDTTGFYRSEAYDGDFDFTNQTSVEAFSGMTSIANATLETNPNLVPEALRRGGFDADGPAVPVHPPEGMSQQPSVPPWTGAWIEFDLTTFGVEG